MPIKLVIRGIHPNSIQAVKDALRQSELTIGDIDRLNIEIHAGKVEVPVYSSLTANNTIEPASWTQGILLEMSVGKQEESEDKKLLLQAAEALDWYFPQYKVVGVFLRTP